MIRFKLDMTAVKQAAAELRATPGAFKRARISALKSTGWMIMTELRNHVEYGGTNWKPLHPMTVKYRKSKRYNPGATPLFFLGRFARYRVDDAGTIADIDFGKSKRGRPGTFDPDLLSMVKRHEEGLRIPVTEKMRGFFGATRPKGRRGTKAVAGRDYFPLRKSTGYIEIPRRAIFDPVWRKVGPRVPAWFDARFREALERYVTGAPKS